MLSRTPILLVLALFVSLLSSALATDINSRLVSRMLSIADDDFMNFEPSGRWLFCAGRSRFTVYDFAEPTRPSLVATLPTSVSVIGNALGISSNRVHLVRYGTRYTCIDVSNPTAPRVIADHPNLIGPPNTFSATVIQGNYIYAVDASQGLRILDVSDPIHPSTLGMAPLATSSGGINTDGRRGVAVTTSGVAILDVSSPGSPRFLGAISFTNSQQTGVGRRGAFPVGNLVVCQDSGEFTVFDATNPAQPKLLNRSVQRSFTFGFLEGTTAFGGLSGSIAAMDLSDPAHPTFSNLINIDEYFPVNIRRSGSLFFSSGSGEGLDVFESVAAPVLNRVSTTPLPALPSAIAHAGSTLLVGSALGLDIFDVADPGRPTAIGHLGTGNPVSNIRVVGNRLYLEQDGRGLLALDFTQRTNPIPLNWSYAGQASGALAIGPHHVYRGLRRGELVVDALNTDGSLIPGAGTTEPLASITFSRAVALTATHLFLVGSSGDTFSPVKQILVYSLANPAKPTRVATAPVRFAPVALSVSGTRLYGVGDGPSLYAWDISDPSKPTRIGTSEPPSNSVTTRNAVIQGPIAYLASGYTGLAAYDLSDPAHPAFVGRNDAIAPWVLSVSPVGVWTAGYDLAADSGAFALFKAVRTVRLLTTAQGAGSLNVTGPVGAVLGIEGSEDLIHWLPVGSVTLGSDGVATTPVSISGQGSRFFRSSGP